VIPLPTKKSSKQRFLLTGWEFKIIKHKGLSKKIRKKISLSRREKRFKPSVKNIEATIKRLKENYSGENNLNAKTFYLISPENETFTVIGALPSFCKEHNINVNVMRNWVNKGKIPYTNRKENKIRNNTNGWEIKTDLGIEGRREGYYYILTSPQEEKFTIYNGLKEFCKKQKINYDCLILNKNKGKIQTSLKCFTEERINTVGWEIKKII
jgi:isochorismate synthase EntC